MYYKEEHIVEGSINKSVCKCLWQGWMRGNMSIQRIVQITVYGILYTVYTVIPSPQPGSLFHLAPDLFCLCVSDLLMLSSPEPEPGQGGASLITIHWPASGVTTFTEQLHDTQHTQRLHYPGHASFIRCNLVWDTEPGSDGWRLIFPGQRHTGRGSGNPRLLMSRWGSRAQPDRQHLLIFHPVHLHNKQETHQVSQPTVLLWFSP